jgi:hypothetical protein
MVVQDARTGIVEYLGVGVSDDELTRLRPRGFAPNARTVAPTKAPVEAPREVKAPEVVEAAVEASDAAVVETGEVQLSRKDLKDLELDELRELAEINHIADAATRRRGTLVRELQFLLDSDQLSWFHTSD